MAISLPAGPGRVLVIAAGTGHLFGTRRLLETRHLLEVLRYKVCNYLPVFTHKVSK